MSFGVLAGIALVVGLILAVGLLSGRRVKDFSDFLSGSGKASTFLVAGAIMGSLVGSQATMAPRSCPFSSAFPDGGSPLAAALDVWPWGSCTATS